MMAEETCANLTALKAARRAHRFLTEIASAAHLALLQSKTSEIDLFMQLPSPLGAWFRRPRHLLPLFLLITLVPSCLLIYSGWRFIEQDRALELRRAEQRVDQAADLVVSAMGQILLEAESALARNPDTLAGDDAVVVRFARNQVDPIGASRLLFYPLAVPGREAPPHRFQAAEELEIVRKDLVAAAELLRRLSKSPDTAVRAGALIRLARVERKAGNSEAALQLYEQAARLPDVAVMGVPADLLARWAQCGLLERKNRRDELAGKAGALQADILSGRWRLDRATFEVHLDDAVRWSGKKEGLPEKALGFAVAASRSWNDWIAGRTLKRQTIVENGARYTLLTRDEPDGLWALISSSRYVETRWLAALASAASRHQVRVAIQEGDSRGLSSPMARRTSAETGLPWTLFVHDTGGAEAHQQLAARRNAWLVGLFVLLTLLISGTCVIARAINRELAVARLQSDFVSAVSHEFRTPLTSLGQLTEILLEDRIRNEDRRRTYYEAMARQTDRLRRLVESLLDFGRMEAGATPYRLEPLDACELVRSVAKQFEPEAARRGFTVEVTLCDEAAPIAGDSDALTNALWNLLDNAVKYSPDCRTVWICIRRAGSGRLAIEVRDRGLGIPCAEQREIFRKFVRGSVAKSSDIPGTGIGLAMVRHIVEAHGGEIRVESRPGDGSTFSLLLPMEEAECRAF